MLHKWFPPNAWMKVADFHVLTSCPRDELHQWFIGLDGEHIIPAIVHRYTTVLQRPDLIWLNKNKNKHPIISNEAVARVFSRLADRLQGVVADTSTMTISTDYSAHFMEVYVKKTDNAKFTGDRIKFLMLNSPFLVCDLLKPEVSLILDICYVYTQYIPDICLLTRLLN